MRDETIFYQCKFFNFIDLFRKLTKKKNSSFVMFQGGYPARLKKVLIVTAPLWFKAPFKILRLFVREKLRERVFTVSVPQLCLHVPRDSLPIHLGGTLNINHSTWLLQCQKSMTNREDEFIDDQLQSSKTTTATTQNNDNEPSTTCCDNENGIVDDINNRNIQSDTVNDSNKDALLANTNGDQLNGMWSENPPSSASSGFSDDDSLACNDGDPKTIEQIVNMVRELGRNGLAREYQEIKSRAPDGTFQNARNRNNLVKNRYTDVLCYDHSRVVLSQDNDEPTTDYINANFVDGYKQKNAYISTQGKSINKYLLFINKLSKFIDSIFCFVLCFVFSDSIRTITKNDGRFLANGMGTALFSYSYDNKSYGTWSCQMRSILGK